MKKTIRSVKQNRFLKFLSVFLIVLFIISLVADRGFRYLDLCAYKYFYFNQEYEEFNSDEFYVIDVPVEKEDEKDTPLLYRKKIAKLLDHVNSLVDTSEDEVPNIILDFIFGGNQNGVPELQQAIKSLNEKRVNVYAVYEIKELGDFLENESYHATTLYDNSFHHGRLHTTVTNCCGVIWYKAYYNYKTDEGKEIKVNAMPLQVASDLNSYIDITEKPETIILPYGNMQGLIDNTWSYSRIHNENSLERIYELKLKNTVEPDNNYLNPTGFDVNGKTIIIGDLSKDVPYEENGYKLKGPYLLAWAIFDQLKDNESYKEPIDNIWLQFFIVIIGVVLITIMYDWIYKRFKNLKSKPILIILLILIVGGLFLFILLQFPIDNKIIRPSFPAVSMALTAIFIGIYKHKFIKDPTAEGGGIDDIFISYSRMHSDWVTQYVIDYLKNYKTKNGKSIKIFFDVESIRAGENFTAKIRERIFNSNAFMPIVSWPEYFDKDRIYCLLEFEQADSRIVANNMEMFPITYDINYIPKQYRTMNWIIVDKDNPQFYEKLDQWLESVFGGD
ncbi:toll/interleukin-1 receptor domain-containing protein [Flavobacteriaceae sp. LMIT009]